MTIFSRSSITFPSLFHHFSITFPPVLIIMIKSAIFFSLIASTLFFAGCSGRSTNAIDIPADNPYAITAEQEKMMKEKQGGSSSEDLRKQLEGN
jgi:hypothetical protein